MKILKRTETLESKDYIKKHLNIINSVLPMKMTDSEIQVLSTIMFYARDGDDHSEFSKENKDKVMTDLGISKSAISNHIKKLNAKGIVFKKNREWCISSGLSLEKGKQVYQFIINEI